MPDRYLRAAGGYATRIAVVGRLVPHHLQAIVRARCPHRLRVAPPHFPRDIDAVILPLILTLGPQRDEFFEEVDGGERDQNAAPAFAVISVLFPFQGSDLISYVTWYDHCAL